jgi:LmbE family N-acetylglucosaminyl deacetylase
LRIGTRKHSISHQSTWLGSGAFINNIAPRERWLDDGEELRSDYLLVRRPHFHLRDNALFFLASEPPIRLLSDAQVEFWTLIHRPTTVEVARTAFGAATDALIREFLRSEFCEVVEATFPSGRRRVLVIEPHADDAALSIGGAMWLRRRECCFVVATMASRSNHTIYYDEGRDFFDVGEVSEIRRRESELFVQMVGGEHVSVGLTDAALRYRDANWSLDFFLRHRTSISVRISRVADNQEQEQWNKAVRRLLADVPSAEVWIPLGGPHTDHMLTAAACFELLLGNSPLLKDRVVRVYEDIPYAARERRHMNSALAALKKRGVDLLPELVPIDCAYDQKVRMASVFASQNIQEMLVDVEATARGHGSAAYSELLWTVRGNADHAARQGLALRPLADEESEAAVRAWVSRNKQVGRLRVLLTMPTGRWAADLELLSGAFAKATFEVYVSPAAAAEVCDATSARVEMSSVPGGSWAWVSLSLRLAAMKPQPTLFLAGDRRLRQAQVLSKLWIGSDTLIAASMDQLVRHLRAQLEVG